MLVPVTHGTASDAAMTALFEAICDGTIPPGTHLRLHDLATQLGVSVMPVREAIRQLAAMDLVDFEPHRGARVRPMTKDDLQDTYATRTLLESEAVRLAASRFQESDELAAREALAARERFLASGDLRSARDAHERFHFSLYEAAGNAWLLRTLQPLWRNSERYRLESFRHPEVASLRTKQHEEILAAVLSGDGDSAAEHLAEHLASSRDLVLPELT